MTLVYLIALACFATLVLVIGTLGYIALIGFIAWL